MVPGKVTGYKKIMGILRYIHTRLAPLGLPTLG